jgi:tetratricopeptide (TPR) repeat protein
LKQFVFAAILAAAGVAHAQPQQELGQLDASPTLFTVMAAINAAGYDADLASPTNHPLRQIIREELAKRTIPSLPALKEFFAHHRQRTDGAELSQYISFGLLASGPPSFVIRQRDVEIPPDVAPLQELSPLLAAFYKEAGIADLWRRSQPAIDQFLQMYHRPVLDIVLRLNSYMRQQTSGVKGRRFQILVELLAAPNHVERRSYGYQDTVVITPSAELRTFDVRHAYLHYLLDPLASRYQEILDRKKGLIDHAMRARSLDEVFQQDFLQLATECLIKAVESRLDRQPEKVQQSLLQGFILTPYFAEHLAQFEQQEESMEVYYPEMVGAIDLIKEDARLSQVDFNRQAPVRTVTVQAPAPSPMGAAKTLDEAEKLYLARDLEKAKKLYLQVLEQTDVKPMHAAAYYGLARIAILSKDPETAERLFRKTLESEPEPVVKAWALVYLGRLELAAGERDQAVSLFQSALKVDGASDKAREEARRSLEASSKQ